MPYLIDANNLAGKLKILNEKDFDRILIDLVNRFVYGKHKKAVLVFDGAPWMKDEYLRGAIKVIYAGKDYGETADSKIIRIITRAKDPGQYTLVTDDREVIDSVDRICRDRRFKIKMISCLKFADELNGTEEANDNENVKRLDRKEIEELNKELYAKWVK